MKEKEIYNVIKCKVDQTVETVFKGAYTECLSYCLNKLDQYKNQRFDLKIIKINQSIDKNEIRINNEDILHCEKLYECTNRGYSCKNCIRNSNVNVFEGHDTDCFYNSTLENSTIETKYIVKYAPIINNGYSKQDLETMVIISDLKKDEVTETIRSNFNKANVDKPWFNGIYLSVQTVDEFLKTIPTYKL